MYAWLDNHNAHACGEQLAFVKYESEDNLFEELKADINSQVNLAQKNHVYVVFKEEAGNAVGMFLAGKRMKAPWVGYGSVDGGAVRDEA